MRLPFADYRISLGVSLHSPPNRWRNGRAKRIFQRDDSPVSACSWYTGKKLCLRSSSYAKTEERNDILKDNVDINLRFYNKSKLLYYFEENSVGIFKFNYIFYNIFFNKI